MSETAVPKIDDGYWFEWSKQHLDSAMKRRDAAFEKLQNLVLWLWGIYTTFATTGFALSEKSLDLGSTIVISVASVLLIAVYWTCVWGQMPVPVEFDPRSPSEICDAHYNTLRKKDTRLKLTMVLSMVAVASVAVALLIAGVSHSKEAIILDAASVRASDTETNISLSARIKPKTKATLDIVLNPGTTQEKKEAPRLFISNDKGTIQTSIRVASAESYRVHLVWQDEDVVQSIARVIDHTALPPAAKERR